MIDALEEFEAWCGRRLGWLTCSLRGHPALEWPGPGWVSVARACPRCGAPQFITA